MQEEKEILPKHLLCVSLHTQLWHFLALLLTPLCQILEYNNSHLPDEENKGQRSAVLSEQKNLVELLVP